MCLSLLAPLLQVKRSAKQEKVITQPHVRAHLVNASLVAASSGLRSSALSAALTRSWLRCRPVVPAVDTDLS